MITSREIREHINTVEQFLPAMSGEQWKAASYIIAEARKIADEPEPEKREKLWDAMLEKADAIRSRRKIAEPFIRQIDFAAAQGELDL